MNRPSERPPTNDVAAFDLYARANNFLLTKSLSNPVKENLLVAIDLLNQAVTRDPAFFKHIANSPGHTGYFIPLAWTILPIGWPWRRWRSKQRFTFVRMRLKRIWRAHGMSIRDTSITTALWLNWKLLVELCPMTGGSSS